MSVIYEIIDGKLSERTCSNDSKYTLASTSHLIIHQISDDYLCVINSFTNKSFIIMKKDWHDTGNYPEGLAPYIDYPLEPLKELNLPKSIIDTVDDSVSFVIILSYACNLRCKYCYQQCDSNLRKDRITSENLEIILNTIEKYHLKHPEKTIYIELFGGEPLLPENYDDIIRIFDFCVDHRFPISITTNGVNLPFYLKDLVIYSGLNISINTTIDSISSNEATRFSETSDVDSCSNNILKSIMTLINYDVTVNVEANIDQHNIDQLEEMIEFYRNNGFLCNPNFNFCIARVDDRRFETGYSKMVTDTQLIEKLLKLNICEPNIYYSFIKSTLALCKKIDPNFRQMEKKYVSNYCWASAPIDKVFYIDPDLDVFRCTFSVGRKQYSLFKFSLDALEGYKLPNRTYKDYAACKKCGIGGYCSGGCALSAEVDFKSMCSMEMGDFNDFLKSIYYPYVQKLVASL